MKFTIPFRSKILGVLRELRHILAAAAVLLNGLLIFKALWGMPATLSDLFSVHDLSDVSWFDISGGPWFLLGILLVLNSVGLLYRSRLAWAVSLVILLITLAFTLNFYPDLHGRAGFTAMTLLILLLLKGEFTRSSATAGGIFAVISFIVLLFYASYGSLYFGKGFAPPINDLVTAVYFSIVTMTTVGYGDIIPKTESARLFSVSMIVAGITVFATSLTTVFGPILHRGLSKLVRSREPQMERKNHFIVCGVSVLSASTIIQLRQRGLPLTLVTTKTLDELAQLEQRAGGKLDIVTGDSTDNEILEAAGVRDCRALLAVTDDDAFNAFVVLTAKEMNPDIKTVLVVNDAKNMRKVKQVKADVVLSPQLFGSEILASVLSGEDLDHQKLISMLLTSGHGLFDTTEETA
ncbi:voltage-gated potassium channel protein [Parendozoicomonas haliclonae]|uniref:Voltage-gated potassium channel Kch n=1 Tax=Parendozoicomonas haliclonae TaxID=1960125 RepID=A0A1X7AN76_9GAMM|nr:voltage-gated potassium channel protein [Parendozoicomonas haliclonae]SMA49567.1 Voltage-gated potassium channel Kch [Parendozoicomonas haliclonae]